MTKKKTNLPEVRLTDEALDYLESRVKNAIAEGMESAMSQENAEQFWRVGIDMLGRQAREGAGGFFIEGVTRFFKTAFWICFIGMAVYATGGWSALKGFLAAVSAK